VQRVNEDVPPPSAVAAGLAPELDALVARATARDPEGRPADALAMLDELRAVRAGLTDAELDRPPVEDAGPAGSEDPTSVVQRLPAVPDGDDEDVHHTTRLMPPPLEPAVPPPPPAPAVRGSWWRDRKGPLAVLVALLVVLGVGGGVWYVKDGRYTQVPGVLSLPQAQAEHRLSSAGLDVAVREDFSLTVPRGSVISTDPVPGKRIRSGGTVTLTVSKGPREVAVPDVTHRTLAEARKQVKAAGLTPGTVSRSFNDLVPQGQVIVTDPPAGRKFAPGTPVAFTVSRGSPVDVPDVIGDSVADAQQALQEAGFRVALAPDKVYSDEADKDTVALESPDRNTQAARGDTVTLTVSKGKQLFPVPDVTGKSQGEAEKILHDAGFKTRVIALFFSDTVFSQSPDGGSQSPKGTTVTLWVR
jgi:serine/threonine-protein kinase